jgi:hypothetical protein
MASSDYTTLRRIQQTYYSSTGLCNTNTTPTCTTTTIPSANNYLTINNSACQQLPTCQTITTDTLTPCITNELLGKLFKYEKYITKTPTEYNLTPVTTKGIGVTITPNLLINVGDHLRFYMDSDRNNNFKGIINGYDNVSGYLSIYNIYDINGIFTTRTSYSIHLVMCEPDIFKLKERIDVLFQYLFNINLDETPDYNPVLTTIGKKENYIYNLFMYFFNINIRQDSTYALTESYLLIKIQELYLYLFDVSITTQSEFNPNGNSIIPLNLQDYISQLYLYLFNINIFDYTFYNILG